MGHFGNFEIVKSQAVARRQAKQAVGRVLRARKNPAKAEHLVSGKVKPGDRLPSERQLAEKLRVSRSTIRDALKSLGMLGLIRAKPGGGSYFQDVPSSLLPRSVEWGLLIGERHTLDLVEARGIIEVGVARLAAQRIDKEGVDRLQDALAKMKSAQEDPKRFVEADLEFHFRLADASRNSSLYEILSGMRTLLDVWIRRVVYAAAENGDLRPRYRRHVAIFDAVKKGDLDAAARAMEEHMASASASLKATLEQHRETKR
jgi:GntR family transcriptional regulator, transcriptional repressor for pyruvate dehydrogenase complex